MIGGTSVSFTSDQLSGGSSAPLDMGAPMLVTVEYGKIVELKEGV